MKCSNLIWVAFLIILSSFVDLNPASAQALDGVVISGQLRQRTEYSAKDFNADVENPFFSLLRTRLNVGVSPVEDLKVFLQFQDSRTWGGESAAAGRGTLDGNAPAFDVHQAFFDVKNVFKSEVSAKIGRQEINIGNERLVGALGWHNVARTFDAARFRFQLEKVSFDLVAARLVGNTTDAIGQNLFGLVAGFSPSGHGKFESLVLLDNDTRPVPGGPDEAENTLDRVTIGLTYKGQSNRFEYELEGYYQTGNQLEAATAKRGSIGAHLASGRVGYLVNQEKGLKIGALFTQVSGDDNATDGKIKNFDTLFATNHKFYGFMDYFVGAGSFARGLQDAAVTLSMKANDRASVGLDIHNFTAPEALAGTSSTLGQEIDFTLNYTYNKALGITGGVSAFFPGDDFGGEDNAFWAYLSTTVTF
ncbi:MAG: alginate export family protein [Bacteroidetes bacterium]|nr:alginate export family protein [Bacteroidota bacterium]